MMSNNLYATAGQTLSPERQGASVSVFRQNAGLYAHFAGNVLGAASNAAKRLLRHGHKSKQGDPLGQHSSKIKKIQLV
jgi:hypothetical protein